MAVSCTNFRTNLAYQTPVFDKIFLPDYKPLDSPVIGRHMTEAWKDGTGDTHTFDRIQIGMPDLNQQWQQISAGECAAAICGPPIQMVAFGTTRNTYFKEQIQLRSQPFCLTQMRHQTNPQDQIEEIYRGLKKIPEMFMTDWIRVHAFDYNTSVQICSNAFGTFTPVRGSNVNGQLTQINLGGTGNLPQSELTFPYLNYLTTILGLQGYSENGSGLSAGMYNLITHSRVWFKLTNGMDSMKDMMALTDPQQASALYKIGIGIQKPFGNIAATLDEQQIRFQDMGNGLLNRVYPYVNIAGSTGTQRQVNPAWVQARYALSFLWQPRAIKIWSPNFSKIHPMIPTVNSSFYGQWQFVNPQGNITLYNGDGTTCVVDNSDQRFFFWLCDLEQGFQFMFPEMLYPILHLIDGSGYSCAVNQPVCGTAPQYQSQSYSDTPIQC